MGLRKILNLKKLMDVKLNETKNHVFYVHTSPTMCQRLKALRNIARLQSCVFIM
jgi:hypothetical protein